MAVTQVGVSGGDHRGVRGRLEATEREKAELQRKLTQFTGYQAGPGMGAMPYLASDLQKQLEMVHQQLAFKDQEVNAL